MSKKYASILSPVRIGGTIVKNRLVYPNASPHLLQGPEDYPAEGYMAFFSSLARNGAGIVTLAEWNDPKDRSRPWSLESHMQYIDTSNAAVQNYISQLADEIHFYGSRLLLCCDLVYPEGFSHYGGPERRGGIYFADTKPLPEERMHELADAFAQKARHARNLGFDGITMRTDKWMQPGARVRNDSYGGCIENRTRVIVEAYRRVKEELGAGFITEAECAGEQPNGYTGNMPAGTGYTIEDTIAFCRAAEDVVDIIQLREKDMCASHPTGYTFREGEHPTIGYSEAIKAAGIRILTEPIGGFQDPDEIEEYIASGKCDMIGMARGFFSNPEYGRLLEEGRGEDVIPCLWCNRCHGTMAPAGRTDPWLSVCSVNPVFGIEHKLYRLLSETKEKRRVAVVGGGPVGMRCAIMAAKRGHEVTLFERTGYLGGQLLHAEYFSFKWPLKNFRDWEVMQMDKLGVSVRLHTEPDPEDLAKEGFDAVIAATGAEAVLPESIRGLRDENGAPLVKTCHDVFGRADDLGRHVIICGASEVGMETAMYLCENGHEVTMLTRQPRLGSGIKSMHSITMAWIEPDEDGSGRGHMAPAWEKYKDVLHGITEVTTLSVEKNTVTYMDKSGAEHSITGDDVVICGGVSPRVDEAMLYAGCADTFLLAGDCNGCVDLQRGMRDALAKVNMIH